MTWVIGNNTFSMFNSAEYKINPANNSKMPTNADILIYIGRLISMLIKTDQGKKVKLSQISCLLKGQISCSAELSIKHSLT